MRSAQDPADLCAFHRRQLDEASADPIRDFGRMAATARRLMEASR